MSDRPAIDEAAPLPLAGESLLPARLGSFSSRRDESRGGSHRRRGPRRCGLARRRPGAIALYVAALALAALVFVNPLQSLALLGLLGVVLLGAGCARAAAPYLKTGLYIAVFLALVNPLVSHNGSTVLFQLPLPLVGGAVTLQAVVYGLAQALRVFALITAFALLTLVLDPDDQLALMSRVSFRSGLVVSLACRLLPVLSRDAGRIRDAQRARGLELDAGRRRERAAAHVPLLGALLVQTLERAMDVAASMEARGFGAHARTRWSHGRRWLTADRATAAAAAVAAAALLYGLVTHAFSYNFYPLLDPPLAQLGDVAWLLCLAALATPALWALLWRPSPN